MSAPALFRDRWDGLAARERRLLAAAAVLVAAALMWWLALAPALATLRSANQQHQTLDAQLQNMLALKAEATALQTQTRAGGEDSRRALEASLKQAFGALASVQVAGGRASVNLKGVSSGALANWLVDARANARLLPAEVRLVRSVTPGASELWDGSLVLNFPPR